MKIIDLSHVIESSPQDVPAFLRVEVSYTDHAAGAAELEEAFGLPPRLLRDGEGPASEFLSIGSHAGNPRRRSLALQHDDWRDAGPDHRSASARVVLRAGGGVVDARAKADGEAVTVEEMRAGLAAARHKLRAGNIVLVQTGRDAFYHERDYMFRGCGVTPEATRWLFDQGVRVMGIDAWTVACFPLKIKHGSAGLARVVAILDPTQTG